MMLSTSEYKIGFIGIGRMGQHIVRHISKKYSTLFVYFRCKVFLMLVNKVVVLFFVRDTTYSRCLCCLKRKYPII